MFAVRPYFATALVATVVVAGCAQKSDHEQPVKILKPDQVKITLGAPPAAAEPPAAAPAESSTPAAAPAEEAKAAVPAPSAEAKPEEATAPK